MLALELGCWGLWACIIPVQDLVQGHAQGCGVCEEGCTKPCSLHLCMHAQGSWCMRHPWTGPTHGLSAKMPCPEWPDGHSLPRTKQWPRQPEYWRDGGEGVLEVWSLPSSKVRAHTTHPCVWVHVIFMCDRCRVSECPLKPAFLHA